MGRNKLAALAVFAGLAFAVGAPFAHPARAAAESAVVWDEALTDFNGVWASPTGGQVKMWFSREVSGFSDAFMDKLVLPRAIDNGDVTYEVQMPNLVVQEDLRRIKNALREKGVEVPEDLSTIRRVWDRSRQSFTILMIDPVGNSTPYGFVRKLTQQEQAQISTVKARMDDVLRQQNALIAKEQQSKAASSNRQQSILQSPEAQAAAQRLGIGAAFFASSPAAQEVTLRDATASIDAKIKKTQKEIEQINKFGYQGSRDDFTGEGKKRLAELARRMTSYEQQMADLTTISVATGATQAADDEGDAKADSYYEDAEEEQSTPPKR